MRNLMYLLLLILTGCGGNTYYEIQAAQAACEHHGGLSNIKANVVTLARIDLRCENGMDISIPAEIVDPEGVSVIRNLTRK